MVPPVRDGVVMTVDVLFDWAMIIMSIMAPGAKVITFEMVSAAVVPSKTPLVFVMALVAVMLLISIVPLVFVMPLIAVRPQKGAAVMLMPFFIIMSPVMVAASPGAAREGKDKSDQSKTDERNSSFHGSPPRCGGQWFIVSA